MKQIASIAALGLCLSASGFHAATGCAEDAMLVFDGAASMSEITFDIAENTRIEDARLAMAEVMPQIAPFRRIGLLIYGPGPNGACGNLDLHFGPKERAANDVVSAVNELKPNGLTPMAASVLKAAETLQYRTDPGVVVVVTDGNETCGGRPCALADQLAATARDLTVHVIGFKVIVDGFAWDNPEQQAAGHDESVSRCLADKTGGLFVNTKTVDELIGALNITLGCPVIGRVGLTLPRAS